MRIEVSVQEAQTRLCELLKTASAGDEVIIVDQGRPVGRLVPVDTAPSGHRRGSKEAILSVINSLPDGPPHLTDEEIAAYIRELRAD